MLALAEDLRERGASLRVLNLGGGDVDTATPMGSMVFTVMAALAQMELEIKRERITDSVSKRRAAGKDLGGRRQAFTDSQVRNAVRLIDAGEPAAPGARDMGMSRATLYRRLRDIQRTDAATVITSWGAPERLDCRPHETHCLPGPLRRDAPGGEDWAYGRFACPTSRNGRDYGEVVINLSLAAEQLLTPASLVRVEDAGTAPKEMGAYGWWFRPGSLPIPVMPHPTMEGFELLYVGIAPRKPAGSGLEGKSQLRTRLASHTKQDASRSTLRLTLGVLLEDELGLTLGMHKSRVNWGPLGEQALKEWMRQHARVSWVIDDEPWRVEAELLQTVPLPLNISGKAGPFTQSLIARRYAARDAARA